MSNGSCAGGCGGVADRTEIVNDVVAPLLDLGADVREVLQDGDVVEAVVFGLPQAPSVSSKARRPPPLVTVASSSDCGESAGMCDGSAGAQAAAGASTPTSLAKKAVGLRERAASAVHRANQMANSIAAAEVRGRAASAALKPKKTGASLRWEAPPPPPPSDMTIDSPNSPEDRKQIAKVEPFSMTSSEDEGLSDEF